ncbi:MAG: zinc ribbon domain-containing protein [Chloroflexi bacterium]|nr:MAG: zinc ribbon domain-containing protein [Chloroflexota bacterium]
MPIYSYRCQNCGETVEVLLRSSEDRPRCPNCGSESLEKLISASYTIRMGAPTSGLTCCGRTERCDTPPCSTDGTCRRR